MIISSESLASFFSPFFLFCAFPTDPFLFSLSFPTITSFYSSIHFHVCHSTYPALCTSPFPSLFPVLPYRQSPFIVHLSPHRLFSSFPQQESTKPPCRLTEARRWGALAAFWGPCCCRFHFYMAFSVSRSGICNTSTPITTTGTIELHLSHPVTSRTPLRVYVMFGVT